MPQGRANNGGGAKKKKKGRAPAHQNTFAFRHNPKSKLTDRILNSPNVGCCKRCRDKIEWRKKYRKYKPRTQPGKCNLCHRRNVQAAYHTICGDCAVSDKAARQASAALQPTDARANTEKSDGNNALDTADADSKEQAGVIEMRGEVNASDNSMAAASRKDGKRVRMCAVCVSEPAIRCSGDGTDMTDEARLLEERLARDAGNLKLRERKAIERQIERCQLDDKRGGASGSDNEDREVPSNFGDDDSSVSVDAAQDDGIGAGDDPFLKAVGGADKLLTGEAYQRMLLEKDGQKINSEI